jgi:HTH-type transcriptional repressor of NAD biosynthesis genes
MRKGLVLGKFMPLHNGHLALFDFARRQCDELVILLCYTINEPITGATREIWLKKAVTKISNATAISYQYNETKLSNTSVSSRDVSLQWSKIIKKILPDIDTIFSSEPYGDYLADFLGIKHIAFDIKRESFPVSASAILKNPLQNWDFIAAPARPYFLKKIVLLGTESTGKSTLTEKLARHFNTGYVPEMAREVLEKTEDCKPKHLVQIAELHAKMILQRTETTDRLLFIDTDINITRSYSKYLFNQPLEVADWIEVANKADLYLFLEPDCDFVQDGTRLPAEERNKLSLFHKAQLGETGIAYFSITGNWEERFKKAVVTIKDYFKI